MPFQFTPKGMPGEKGVLKGLLPELVEGGLRSHSFIVSRRHNSVPGLLRARDYET